MITTRKIIKLGDGTINKIAAGEVIERPASVVKELVENAIDAGSTYIKIFIESAGYNLIKIEDNGTGMSKEDLECSVYRHTTSKLDENNIHDLQYMGFRGEALSSIISVSRTTITSGHASNTQNSWQIFASNEDIQPIQPVPKIQGCTVEVRDLFCFVPARLKFLKGEKIETKYILQTVQRLAIAHPNIDFMLKNEHKTLIDTKNTTGDKDSIESRITKILNVNLNDMMKIEKTLNSVSITGYSSLPTLHRRQSDMMFIFVNNRCITDKLLIVAVKIAYADVMVKGRYPICCLFFNIPGNHVDVNVHPAKSEIRFRDENNIKNMLISAIHKSLSLHSSSTSSNLTDNLMSTMHKHRENTDPILNQTYVAPVDTSYVVQNNHNICQDSAFTQQKFLHELPEVSQIAKKDITKELLEETSARNQIPQPMQTAKSVASIPTPKRQQLGNACAQLNHMYIIAQNEEGMTIVDQHAAHERIVYEKMKTNIAKTGMQTQNLLLPDIIKMEEDAANALMQHHTQLKSMGFVLERMGLEQIKITSIPSLMAECDIENTVQDIAYEIMNLGREKSLSDMLEHIVETKACKNSIKAGRAMSIDEMNALLRLLENTPHSGQCNHGRPTYIKLQWNEIEKLFGRT